MNSEEKKTCVGLMFIFLMLVSGVFVGGCSFKVEALYHGRTPVGISDTKATALRADTPRVIKVRQEND
jgi:hypothetical protein